ncbi:MAG: AMP-binding protein, partial [bacterium]|nr:AMP-binding protein [bacterium]
ILIDREEIFRTVFVHEEVAEPLQLVLEPNENHVRFLYVDISQIKEKNHRQAYLETIRHDDKKKGFDLSGDMPMRIVLLKTGAQTYLIIWSSNHIIMDGWCLGIIFKELLHSYRHLIEGKPVQLEPVIPYRKYIRWLEKQDEEEGLEFWQKYLEGYEQMATLPKIKKSEAKDELTNEYIQADLEWEIDPLQSERLNKMAQQNGTTLNLVFQTIWGLLLMKYNNSRDAVFGAVVSGRPAQIEGIENMVGLFINTIPVRVTAGEQQEYRQLLKTMHSKTAKTNTYEYQSLADVQAASPLKGRLFDHIMVFENYPVAENMKQTSKKQGLPFELKSSEAREQTNYDFNIVLAPTGKIKIKFSYNTLVYENEIVENIRHHLNRMIAQIVENPQVHVKDIQIVTQKEKNQILYEFNDTAADYLREKTIHQLFEEQVERTPDNIAIVGKEKIKDEETIKDKKEIKEQLPLTGTNPAVGGIHESPFQQAVQITYRELNEKSNRLAAYLKAKGVGPGEIVPIITSSSIEMVAFLQAILKTGAAYLPIDTRYPKDRIKYILTDSNAKIVLNEIQELKEIQEELDEIKELEILDINSIYRTLLSTENHHLKTGSRHPAPGSRHPAYIIYTSGTTGRPKGTVITQRSLVNLCTWHNRNYEVTPQDNATQYAGVAFDAAVWEIFPYQVKGATIHILEEKIKLDIEALSHYYRRENITISFLPSQFCDIFMEKAPYIPSLRALLAGGDKLKRYIKREYKLYNNYGPTENTVVSTAFPVEKQTHNIPIGKPVENVQAYILNKNMMTLQPVGVPGELCISGDGLAIGYLNNPELTT